MSSIWDDPELRTGGDFVRFESVGDSVTGTITGITTHAFEPGKPVPQLFLSTADGDRTLTASQVQLKALLVELRPEVGDVITVTHTKVEKRDGGKTLKHFDVKREAAKPSKTWAEAPF